MVYILVETPVIQSDDSGLFYRFNYRFTEPVNGVTDGTYDRQISTPPELETQINADAPSRIAESANVVANTSQFTAEHVIGGRL